MIIDLNDQRGELPAADICILGAGAAGLMIAHALESSGLNVIVAEAGGLAYDAAGQNAYQGYQRAGRDDYQASGLHYPNGLRDSRLRYLGGSTNHWAGWCGRLDPTVWDSRPWVEASGWPLSQRELENHYRAAELFCDLGHSYHTDLWEQLPAPTLQLDPSRLIARFWQIHPLRFAPRLQPKLAASATTRLLLNATATDFTTNTTGDLIQAVTLTTSRGAAHRQPAKQFVLALGGLENPRLLLNCRPRLGAAVGQAFEHVGRYFMEHPEVSCGEILFSNATRDVNRYFRYMPHPENGDRVAIHLGLDLAPRLQQEQELLNASVSLNSSAAAGDPDGLQAIKQLREHTHRGEFPDEVTALLWRVLSDLDDTVPELWRRARGTRRYNPTGTLHARIEQAPNPASRVSLSPQRDRYGLRRLILDWQLGEREKRTLRVLTHQVALEMGRLGIGRVRPAPWLLKDDETWEGVRGGYHHMGTTRMAKTPRDGVVDTTCRVFGLGNLYIAGSSVFPAGGQINPTLTILALALRLADTLQSRIRMHRPAPV